MNPRILIADDEPDVRAMLRTCLYRAGFEIFEAEDGQETLERARRVHPSLIVLDIMMPGLTGLEVLKLLKRDDATSTIPIILLSAHAQEVNRIVGLELGAEDFLSKPFSPRELVLRAQNLLRQRQRPPAAELQVGAICVDLDRRLVTVSGAPVVFTATEFRLLLILLNAAGRVLTRGQLLHKLWDDDADVDARTVDTHIGRLRDKLGASGAQIRTVRGFGYRLDAEPGSPDFQS